jgi:hypothetical protein
MSTISLYRRHPSEATSKLKIKTTSLKQDYFVIMATSSIFLGMVLITMLMVPVMITSSSGLTMGEISDCRKKTIGWEQMGYYSSPDQFRLAESYCYMRTCHAENPFLLSEIIWSSNYNAINYILLLYIRNYIYIIWFSPSSTVILVLIFG